MSRSDGLHQERGLRGVLLLLFVITPRGGGGVGEVLMQVDRILHIY